MNVVKEKKKCEGGQRRRLKKSQKCTFCTVEKKLGNVKPVSDQLDPRLFGNEKKLIKLSGSGLWAI